MAEQERDAGNRHARVALEKCGDGEAETIHAAVHRALAALPETDALIRPGKTVFLKLNLVTNAARADGICTDPEIVRAVVNEVRARGASVQAGDNPAIASASSVLKSSGIGPVLKELEVETPDLGKTCALECPRGDRFREFQVSQAIMDADVLLNLPKLKTHALTYMSMSMKNLFGVIPGTRKARWHMKAPHADMMAGLFNDLYSGVVDHFSGEGRGILHLCDGVTALEGDGPGHSGRPKFLGAVLASADGVALDRVGIEVAGLDSSQLATLQKAIKRKLGVGDLACIDVLGAQISDFSGVSLAPPSHGGMRPEGFGIRLCNTVWVRNLMTDHPQLADASKCVGCRRCASICPAGAITFREGEGAPRTPVFNKDPCIRCYCCAEVCPVGIIEKSTISFLGRLLRRL
jgi:Uncharacterized conserved protein